MPLLPEQVPKHNRELVRLILETEAFGPGDKCFLGFTRLGNAGEVALDVGGEDRDAGAGKPLRQHLQGYGLPGAGRSSDQSMAGVKRMMEHFSLKNVTYSYG